MLNIQTLLPNFPNVLMAGLVGASVLCGTVAEALTCGDLFQSGSIAQARHQAAREKLMSEVLAPLSETLLSAHSADSARVQDPAVVLMMEQIKSNLAASIRASTGRQTRRPRVMTGDEARTVLETGSYNLVDMPATPRRALTEFEAMLQTMQRQQLAEFERALAQSAAKEAVVNGVSESTVRRASENPELLAIAYGQITGLTSRLGPNDQGLNALINGTRLPRTNEIRELSALVVMIRAANATPASTARVDEMMAEVIRAEISLNTSGERR